MRTIALLAISLLIVGLSAVPARADEIQITAGTLTVDRRGGTLQLEGTGGFSLDALVDGSPLLGAVLRPGETLAITMLHMGARGSLTLDGQTFQFNGPTDFVGADLGVSGSLVAPPFSGDTEATLFAPFTFAGRIMGFPPGPEFQVTLRGGGTAQVDFLLNPFVDAWEPQRAIYRFEVSDTDPIPEPATLLLVGSGIAGCLAGRRRRRRARGG